MATSLLYLGLYLGPYSILVTAGSGSVYSCYSCCGCYRVARAVIKVTSSTAIKTTYSTAVKIASGISRASSRISGAFYSCYRNSRGAYYGAYYRTY